MAEKKMTQVTALEMAIAMFDGEGLPESTQIEAREILAGMVEKRKNTVRKPRVNKEAEAFRAELVEFLAGCDAPVTNGEMAEHFAVKPQKVANNIRVLEKAGKVTRIRSEKPSEKDTFALA